MAGWSRSLLLAMSVETTAMEEEPSTFSATIPLAQPDDHSSLPQPYGQHGPEFWAGYKEGIDVLSYILGTRKFAFHPLDTAPLPDDEEPGSIKWLNAHVKRCYH